MYGKTRPAYTDNFLVVVDYNFKVCVLTSIVCLYQDLEVKSSPPPQREEQIYEDPPIIQVLACVYM